jgi:hypothetical protein
MTDYKCGHSTEILILDDNPLSIIAYLEWVNSVGRDGTKEFCFDCWSKKPETVGAEAIEANDH